jgi:hypothetical protein
MRTDLHGETAGRQRPGHQRPITPVLLTLAIGSLTIAAREDSPTYLSMIGGRAGYISLSPRFTYHPNATVTDSLSQRPSFFCNRLASEPAPSCRWFRCTTTT